MFCEFRSSNGLISVDMTEKFFRNLEADFGRTFVRCLAGYVTAAKYGLTEMELIDILSCNKKVTHFLG